MSDELAELPESWNWVALEDICYVVSGFAFKSNDFCEHGVPAIKIANISHGEFLWKQQEYLPFAFLERFLEFQVLPNTLLIALTRPITNNSVKICFYPANAPIGLLNQRVALIKPHKLYSQRLLLFFSQSELFREQVKSNLSETLQPNLSPQDLKQFIVPLPPLNEQKRIVAQIEALRERSQKAKAALEAIPELCDRFRQSVLAAAFRGDLTADWREENPDVEPIEEVLNQKLSLPKNYQRLQKQTKKGFTNLNKCIFPDLPESWQYSTIQNLYDQNFIIDYADGNHGSLYPRKEEFGEEGILYVTASQIIDGKVNFSQCSRLKPEKAMQLVKGWAQGGDVLLTHNATVGRTALVEEHIDSFLLGTSVTFYRTNQAGLNNVFFYLLLSSKIWQQQLHAIMAQTTRDQVSIQKQAFFMVPIPPLQEQLEIVNRVQSLLDVIRKIEFQYRKAENNLDRLNQSILAKAFRGELVDQDPNDEPASVLLERIRAEREAQQPAKKSRAKGTGRKKRE